jgi:ElaA protein
MLLTWQLYTWKELSVELLYKILALRAEVFVVEQNCPYLDLDGKDEKTLHLCAFYDSDLIGYARIILNENPCVIGRVVMHPKQRAKGYGRKLMQKSIAVVPADKEIFISAQERLKNFYESLGFSQSAEGYLEDGIPHIPMLHPPRNATAK